jgi:two-component system sensor histidine kinase BaeS
MLNNSRIKITILISGVLIILSLALFLGAMSIKDFGQPGQQTLISGRSGVLLVTAFGLLAGIAIALLITIARAAGGSVEMSVSEPATLSDAGEEKSVPIVTEDNPSGDRESLEAAAETRQGPNLSGQILSETAGELKTSVDVIQEELEDMLEDEVPADKEHIESLYNETDRIRKIIVGMEQLSQAQALARSLRSVSVELAPLLNSVIEKIRDAKNDKSVVFNLECEAELTVTADPDCLGRITGNLLDNAVHAVKDAGTVTVTAKLSGEQLILSVRDTGTGIRRSHVPHLFERFFRGAGSGIGMGLAIVKELVDACGGKIEVQTRFGKGSSFTVRIPAFRDTAY